MAAIYVPFALKLHAYGLGRLQDPDWTGMELFDDLKQHVRGRREPPLLHRFCDRGVLFHLGLWLYDEYVNGDHRFEVQNCEHLAWFLEDFSEFLIAGGTPPVSRYIRRVNRFIARLSVLYDKSEEQYYHVLTRSRARLQELHGRLTEAHADTIEGLAPIYAADYADRVFHDRQLCAFIAELLVKIGFDGTAGDDDPPTKWVERLTPPKWARKAVCARDRGKCAYCRNDLMSELSADDHIDHIVPLSRGGCNDLVNLQLLCSGCNIRKSNAIVEVATSILRL